ncbi:MAG: MraY family glycosyltransferase [Chitinophagaceae bacterium]|nr:MraY family glycosyltransferase [Chitinophagaceae bacterium]
MDLVIIVVLITSFLICFILTPVVIYFFVKNNIIDSPGGRKIHKENTPSMGGICIVFGALFSVILWVGLKQLTDIRMLIFSVLIIFIVGLRDDIVNLSAKQKLLGQVCAALLVTIYGKIYITSLGGFIGIYDIPLYVSILLSTFIIISITNAFNLIDGIDGLSGGFSIVSFLFFGIWFYLNEKYIYSLFTFSFIGAVMGFMIYNWNPAKIFMGDTGALSLGFLLSVFSIIFIELNNSLPFHHIYKFESSIGSAIGIVFLPILDTTRVFIKRILKGKSPLKPDKGHMHHFLTRIGYSHGYTTCILLTFNITVIFFIIFFKNYSDAWILSFLGGVGILFSALLGKITRMKMQKKNI